MQVTSFILDPATVPLLYTREEEIENLYLIISRETISKGAVIFVDRAKANTIIHMNIGFVELTASELNEALTQTSPIDYDDIGTNS